MYCLFCHRKCEIRKVCLTCRSGFSKWVHDHTNIKNQLVVHKTLAHVPFTSKQLPRYAGRNWPGFFAGTDNNQPLWIAPDRYYITDTEIIWDNGHVVLMNLLQYHGIDLNETIQIKHHNGSRSP